MNINAIKKFLNSLFGVLSTEDYIKLRLKCLHEDVEEADKALAIIERERNLMAAEIEMLTTFPTEHYVNSKSRR